MINEAYKRTKKPSLVMAIPFKVNRSGLFSQQDFVSSGFEFVVAPFGVDISKRIRINDLLLGIKKEVLFLVPPLYCFWKSLSSPI